MPNVYTSSEIGSQWRTILGHPQLIECMGIKGVPTLFAYCEKPVWKFFFKFNQGTCPQMAFAWDFFPDFFYFFEGDPWDESFIGNTQYFGAQIFPVVWLKYSTRLDNPVTYARVDQSQPALYTSYWTFVDEYFDLRNVLPQEQMDTQHVGVTKID